jgi:hypothetical protein
MRPALDPAGHRVPRTKSTCLLHTWRPHRRRPFALVLHLHQHQSNRNLHLQYLAKNQSTQRCQSLITQESNHPPVLEPHMVLTLAVHRRVPLRPSRGLLRWLPLPARGLLRWLLGSPTPRFQWAPPWGWCFPQLRLLSTEDIRISLPWRL